MKDPKQLLLKNVFSNWASFGVGIVVAFFLSPFLVHSLGKQNYGIWALVFSIIYYTNLLDAGMKQSLARYIPKYYAREEYGKVNEVINSSNLIYSITGTLVILVSLAIATFFIGAFKIDSQSIGLMRATLIIVGFDQAIAFYFMAGTAIGPFHRYDISNIIGIVSSIAQALLIFAFLSMGYGIVTLAAITLISDLIRNIVRRWYQQRLVPQLSFKIGYISKDMIRELLGYGFISFFIVAGWMIVFQSDNIVIGLFISATAVAYYNIAGTLINYLRLLINAIGVPLVPAISHIDALGDRAQVAGLYARLTRYLFYLTTCICAITLMFGAKFIYTWMGPEFIQTVKVLHILIVPVSLYLPQVVANSILLGIGKHRPLLYILLVESAVNLGLSLILVRPLGIYGVALGTATAQILIYTYIFPLVFHRLIGASLGQFYINSLKMIALGLLLTVPIGLVMRSINPSNGWGSLFVDGVVMLVMVLSGFWFGALDNADRDRVIRRFQKGRLAPEATISD